MKTQGWWHHRNSKRKAYRDKVGADATDVDALLDRAEKEMVSFEDESDAYRHSPEFLDRALVLAYEFARRHGGRKWTAIGFPL